MRKIAVLLVTMMLVLIPTTAQAHGWNLYQGNDWVHIGAEHKNVWVHDKECDGNAVYVNINYGSFIWQAKDANGCKAGGTQVEVVQGAREHRLCEYRSGSDLCTSWRDF